MMKPELEFSEGRRVGFGRIQPVTVEFPKFGFLN
jgi:hypothetical protein